MTEKIDQDFATGKRVDLAKPEEAVRQDYERILHHDLGYPKSCIDINVAIQMGRQTKFSDIVVYDDAESRNIIGIVETKAPGESGGREQLKSYMSATSTCRWGVWTNGDELEFRTRDLQSGKITHNPSFAAPRYGVLDASIERYSDLRPASNLKWTFRLINNRLYANTNLARTEKQGAEMVRLIFCKLFDEYAIRKGDDAPAFQVRQGESEKDTRRRINQLWQQTKQGHLGEPIFSKSENIEIDDYSLQLIVGSLQGHSLLQTNRDIVGDAFEVFSERQFAGEKGQFFTPRAVVKMIVEMIQPAAGEKVIDPACGSGGFLIAALGHITQGVDDAEEKKRIAEHCLYGIDKDNDLAKICKAHMSIIGDGKSNIVTADSLKDPRRHWDDHARSKFLRDDALAQFDVLITNPPFGSTIKVEQERVLRQFELGHQWRKVGDGWEQTGKTQPTPPQILFIERCLQLLKEDGRMGIVLPDGILGNPRDAYIRQWLARKAEVLAVVDCPTNTFMPHTGTKTSVLILRKRRDGERAGAANVFFAIAEHCGHTPRGKEIIDANGGLREDFTAIAANYHAGRDAKSHLGFRCRKLQDGVLVPRYYDPRIIKAIRARARQDNAKLVSIQALCAAKKIVISGMPASASSEEYDAHGEVRFIRTSDVSKYELDERTGKRVSLETYRKYRARQDLQIGDILFVKDGDNKIGETAILLTEDDCRVLVQSHFKKIRALDMSPFLLLYLLNTEIVRKQIRMRVFSQSTLSTIGERINELLLPMPSGTDKEDAIIDSMKTLVNARRDSWQKLQASVS